MLLMLGAPCPIGSLNDVGLGPPDIDPMGLCDGAIAGTNTGEVTPGAVVGDTTPKNDAGDAVTGDAVMGEKCCGTRNDCCSGSGGTCGTAGPTGAVTLFHMLAETTLGRSQISKISA
jgi:hypothetical protein